MVSASPDREERSNVDWTRQHRDARRAPNFVTKVK